MIKACASVWELRHKPMMGLDCAHPFNSNRVHFLSKIVKILTQGYSATFPWHWFRRALCKFTCCMIVPCSFTPVPRVLAWYSWWHQSCNLTGCQTFFSWTFAPTFNIIPSFNKSKAPAMACCYYYGAIGMSAPSLTTEPRRERLRMGLRMV